MISVKVNNKNLDLWFGHVQNDGPTKITSCIIYEGEKVLGYGDALCNPVDNFSKITGRKIALTRALEEAFAGDKEAKKSIWSAYLGKCKV